MEGLNLITIPEVAKALRVHPSTIRRFIRDGKLTGLKIGRQWVFEPTAVKKFVENCSLSSENYQQQEK